MPRNTTTRIAITAPTAILAAGLFASITAANAQTSTAPSTEAARAIDTANDLSAAFQHAAQTIDPSLVHIKVERELAAQRPSQPRNPSMRPNPFERFFRDQFPRRFRERQAPSARSQGSGVIVNEDGYILTNQHVIAAGGPDLTPRPFFPNNDNDDTTPAEPYQEFNQNLDITVVLHDGDEHTATLVGSDPETDLALLKVDAQQLTPATFANSDELAVGQWVVAAGSPFGLGQTITTGIVSALGRDVGISAYENFIQTDAAINPGNSGGPLVNLNGHVVGINAAIASRSGGFNGIGFAIPANLARNVMLDLLDDGITDRAFIGISGQNVSAQLAETLGLDTTKGALVTAVTEDTPAHDAGLQPGDLITAIDGQHVNDFQDLRVRVAERSPGDTVTLTLRRDNSTHTHRLTLASRSEVMAQVRQDSANGTATALGITVEPRTAPNADQHRPGVRITNVDPASPAARAGIQPGDIIHAVNRTRIRDFNDWLDAASNAARRDTIALLIATPGQGQRYVTFRTRP